MKLTVLELIVLMKLFESGKISNAIDMSDAADELMAAMMQQEQMKAALMTAHHGPIGPGPGPGPGDNIGPGPGDNIGPGPGDNIGPGPGDNIGPGPGDNIGPGPGDDIGPGAGNAEGGELRTQRPKHLAPLSESPKSLDELVNLRADSLKNRSKKSQ
jgi:hypothetical protein